MPVVNPGIRRQVAGAITRLFNSAAFALPLTHTAIPTRGSITPTFTRATTETGQKWDEAGYLDFTALAGEMVFKGARRVRNLLPSTEGAFNAGAGWTILNGTVTSGVTDPNDGTTAYTLKQTGVASCELYPTTPFSGIVLSSLWIRRRVGSGTISLYSGDSSENITSQVTSEWQRIQGTLPGTSAVVGFDIRLFTQDDEIDIWHPQAEDVTGQADQTASEYVSVGVESAPAYHGSMVDGVKCYDTDRSGNPISTSGSYPLVGYVPWEARTNLQTYSNDFTNAVWNNEVARTVITAAAGTSPSAANDAWSLIPTSNNSAHRVYNPAIVNPSGTFTISLWAKTIGGYNLTLTDTGGLWQADFDLTNGTVATPTTGESLAARIEAWPNGWYRCSATVTSASGNFPLQWITDANKTLSYAGNTTSGVYWYGYQLELGSFASPYIPTTTVAVARNSDVLTYTGADVANIKTLLCDFERASGVSGTGIMASLNDGTANNVSSIRIFDTTARFLGLVGGATQWSVEPAYTAGARSKMAQSWATNDVKMAKDGTGQTPDTTATMPTVTQLNVGHQVGSFQLNGTVGGIYGWTHNLSQSELNAVSKLS